MSAPAPPTAPRAGITGAAKPKITRLSPGTLPAPSVEIGGKIEFAVSPAPGLQIDSYRWTIDGAPAPSAAQRFPYFGEGAPRKLTVSVVGVAGAAASDPVTWTLIIKAGAKPPVIESNPQPGVLVIPADGRKEFRVARADGAAIDHYEWILQNTAEQPPMTLENFKGNAVTLDHASLDRAAKLRLRVWGVAAGGVKSNQLEWTLELAPETNPELEWLPFEARFNASDYVRTKNAMANGLYVLPLDDRAEIVTSREIPQILVDAFFPGTTLPELLAISEYTTRWRGTPDRPHPLSRRSPTDQHASRSAHELVVSRWMVMPYNFYANDTGSHAIGTDLDQAAKEGYRLTKTWTMWETASRSCVVKLQATPISDLQGRRNAAWPFREAQPPGDPSLAGKPFRLKDRLPDCFSVKAGVRWVGKKKQGSDDPGGGKDVLESNAVLASMRSDWIEWVDSQVPKHPKLIVLRELLTVTFPKGTGRDGYQVRDLSPLDRSKIYFPPLSIPFAGQAFVDAFNERNRAKRTFEEFWREAYAEAVGAAKARLLLRYGLQLTTPNPQNFLIEFDGATLAPTGAVVVRDIGDAKIHSEVIQQLGASHPVVVYELSDPKRPGYLPAQTNNQGRADDHYAAEHDRFGQYPLDTRFHWHQYSSFKAQYGVENLPRKTLTAVGWGRAHNRAYLATLRAWLGRDPGITIYGNETWRRLLSDQGAIDARFKPYRDDAQRLAMEIAKKHEHARFEADAWPGVTPNEREILHCETALEAYCSEVLHDWLKQPNVLALVRASWNASV